MIRFSYNRKQWALWYSIALVSAIVGSVLAYSPLLSSEAWQCWSTPTAWKRDSALAVVTTILAIFVLWNMRAFDQEKPALHEEFSPTHLRRYEWILLTSASALLLLYAFVILPNSFRLGLHARMQELSQKSGCTDLENAIKNDDFSQIMKPYFPYLLHVLGLWGGVVLPVFLFLIRCVRVDWKEWNEGQLKLSHWVANAKRIEKHQVVAFEGLLLAFQDQVVRLKTVAERYVPVLLSVSLVLLYEQLTPSSQTVTDAAVESGKFAVWLLLGPTLLTCVVVVALGYQSTAQKTEQGLRALANSHSGVTEDSDVIKRIAEMRSKLVWDQSPGAFILSVAKSATISIPLLLAVIAYVLHLHHEGWFRIFVPRALVEFLQNIYK
jgi:hypothetical protein